jgi:type IV pilus assembly protein PilY1
MKHKSGFRKSVAWAILVCMLNPAMVLPAHALDTDIYTSIQTSANVAQANIVIIIDTGDPMNVPEPWREYDPNVYDSHVEYLWNDIGTYLNLITNDPSVPFLWPTNEYGYWGGQGFPTASTLPADRTILKTNALAWANGTTAGDPAARSYWRNYGGGRSARNDGYQDARLLYWVPTGTAETDLRLTAPSWNKFYGNIARISGAAPRGGITWVALNSNVDSSPTAANNGQTPWNQCKDSIVSTTVDAAMTTAANTLANPLPVVPVSIPMGLMPSTAYAPTNTVRNSGRYLNQQWARWERFLNLTTAGGTYPTTLGAATTGPDTIAVGSAVATVGNSITARNEFLGGNNVAAYTPAPVRDSYGSVATLGNGSTPGSVGQPIRIQNGGVSYSAWTTLKADFGGFNYVGALTNGTYYVSTANIQTMLGIYQSLYYTVAPTAANAQWLAFKGNRDQVGPAPTYDITNGTPAYYDNPVANLILNTGGGGVICTRTCTLPVKDGSTTAPTTDAANNNFASGWWKTTDACTNGGTAGSNCGTAPGACGNVTGNGNYTRAVYSACAWSTRNNLYVQGVGTYYYNSANVNNCVGTCTGPGHIVGAGPVCTTAALSNVNCTTAGTSTQVINGQSLYYSESPPNASTVGCGNLGSATITCQAREGAGSACVYAGACTNTTVSAGTTTNNYNVYVTAADDPFLYHDCRADDPDNNNLNVPASYMTNQTATFNTTWSAATGASKPYTVTAANKLTAAQAPNIDMYSVNYLNWKWGPHSNGNPIGRKTRLQIAKDALVTLVNSTNNVRFGLMNYNLTMNDGHDTNIGAHVTFSVTPMGTTVTTDPSYGTGANTTDITTNRNNLIVAINNMVAGSRSPVTEALYEAYLYFRGEAPFGGLRNGTTLVAGGKLENYGNDNTGANSTNPAICTAALVTSGVCWNGGVNTKYASPMMNNPNPPNVGIGPAACQKNFVIAITEGQAEDDGAANALIQALQFTDPQGNTWSPDTHTDTTQTDTPSHQFETSGQTYLALTDGQVVCQGVAGEPFCNGDQAGSYQDTSTGATGVAANPNNYIWLDELAWYMSRGDMNLNASFLTGSQPVITFTIAFGGQTSPVIQNAAVVAGGQYYIANNSASLASALQQALAAIVAWNPSASSPTVPISALNRTQSSQNVYLAFFGPGGLVNWPGTVKWLELDTVAGDCVNELGITPAVCLIGQTALNGSSKNIEHVITDPSTGAQTIVVNPMAVSFWTPLSGVIPAPVGGNYPLEDGGKPNAGGTGHQLIINNNTAVAHPVNRTMFTHLSTSGSIHLNVAANAFSDNNAILTANPGNIFGVGLTAAQINTLINWQRGGDPLADPNCSDNQSDSTTPCNTFRSWAHSAVLHSRPVVVTYNGTTTPPAQTIYYLSTDGVLHAVDAPTGAEKWSYVIEEAIPQLNNLMTNNAGPPLAIADGAPTVWIQNVTQNGQITGADKAWLYFGMRRGAGGNASRVYYAIDVTNPTDPVFLWKISNTQICLGGGACAGSTAYQEMGQTWSTPAAVNLRALGVNPGFPALVIGGGYDPNEDNAAPAAGSDTMGRALYIIRGDNGQPIQSWTNANTPSMIYAIPSDPAALNMDNNAQGYVNRIYIGDMGARVFRFDVNDPTPANWTVHQIANLNQGTLLKVFFPPVVVREGPAEALGQRFDAVFVGTGDREHPLILTNQDYMFMIKDYFTGFTSTQATPVAPGTMLNITNNLSVDVPTFLANIGGLGNWDTATGWYFVLPNPGEKVSASPEVINNVLNFGTYSPTLSLNVCLPPGLGTLYGINAVTGGLADTLETGSVTAADPRTYASVGIKGRGYVVPGGIIVLNGQVFRVTVVDGALRTIPAGSLYQSRSYWQKEPEL